MFLSSLIKNKKTFCKHIMVKSNLRSLCNAVTFSKGAESFGPNSNIKHVIGERRLSKEMRTFLESNPELLDVFPHIPTKYLRVNSRADHHYLISPKIAKKLVDEIIPFLDLSGKQLIAETNAGLGLISAELLARGVNLVRMYEPCSDFRTELTDFGQIYPNRVELFTKDLFHLSRYANMDKHDRLMRTENLFKNVAKRSWTDEPFMTLIGPMNNLKFLNYIVRAVAFQIIPAIFGRIQILAIMKAKDYAVLAATSNDSTKLYSKLSILLQAVFDIELVDTFPKNMFLPWMGSKEVKMRHMYKNYDLDSRYLVRINFKKNLPLEAETLLHFIYFLRQFYGFGNAYIIPTLEKWLPGSGFSIICLQEDFPDNINIFTKFRDLTPLQVLAIFREMAKHPLYKESSFMGMVQSELLHAETTATDMADVEFQSKFIEDFQEKINED